MTINEYLTSLKVLVEDEILLLKFEPDFQNVPLAKTIRRRWERSRVVRPFHDWLSLKFTNLKPSFVALEPQETETTDAINETLIIRFYTLTLWLTHLEEMADQSDLYPPLALTTRSPLLSYVFKIGLNFFIVKEFPRILAFLKSQPLPTVFTSWVKDLINHLTNFDQVLTFRNRADIIEKIYLIYEFVTDFLDYLDETEFEILESEIEQINLILSWILYLHGLLYSFLLIVEKSSELEESAFKVEFMPLKEILDEHDARLEMMRLLANELTN